MTYPFHDADAPLRVPTNCPQRVDGTPLSSPLPSNTPRGALIITPSAISPIMYDLIAVILTLEDASFFSFWGSCRTYLCVCTCLMRTIISGPGLLNSTFVFQPSTSMALSFQKTSNSHLCFDLETKSTCKYTCHKPSTFKRECPSILSLNSPRFTSSQIDEIDTS